MRWNPAMIVALAALVVSMGGCAVPVTTIIRSSEQVARGAIAGSDIGNRYGSVDGQDRQRGQPPPRPPGRRRDQRS